MSNRSYPKTKKGGRNQSFKKKKNIDDYVYYVGSTRQASDYEITTEFVINHIRKTYSDGEDIATALETLQDIDVKNWKPIIETSLELDDEIRAIEQKQFDMEYKMEYDDYMKRKKSYKNNKTRAYGLILERCTRAMSQKIQARKNFNDSIKGDPIELLKAIREHCLNYQETKYDMGVLTESMRTLCMTRQKEHESLVDYTKRFKVAADIFTSHIGGPIYFSKIVDGKAETINDTDTNEMKEEKREKRKEIIKNTHERFLTCMYLENADDKKYGSLCKTLNTQYALGNDQFPVTIPEATNILSAYKMDNAKDFNKTQNKSNKKKPEDSLNISFAQMKGLCYCCGKQGHLATDCRYRNKPKSEWFINQDTNKEEQSNVQDERGHLEDQDNKKSIGWAGVHLEHQFYQNSDLRTWILLDNQSSTNIFCNKDLVKNIKKVKKEMYLNTNAGTLRSNKQCTIPYFENLDEVWYNEKAMTNILSFARVRDLGYKIEYDSEDDTFTVNTPSKKYIFERSGTNLYYYIPDKPKEVQFVETLQENKNFYTSRQFERAKKARDFYHAMNCPSIPDLLAILRMNLVKDCPITLEDVKIMKNIFGPDIGVLKGKSVRRKPIKSIKDEISVPRELTQRQKYITVALDGITVNSMKFLTTVSLHLYYRTAHYMKNTKMITYEEAIKELMQIYHQGGFRVTEMRLDNEFKPLTKSIGEKFNINMQHCNAQDHVPEAERNNRTIKERVRVNFYQLPFKCLPQVLVIILVTEATKKLNYVPARHGISKYYSPRMIVHKTGLNYKKHCEFTTGSYVQANHDDQKKKNTNAPRTLDGIYLRYNTAHQGGHEILHLPTYKIISRSFCTKIPMTKQVIEHVDAIGYKQKMPSGLKIDNRYNTTLYHSDWLAGVDYEETNKNSDDSDMESDNLDDDSESDDDDEDNDDDSEDNNESKDSNESEDSNDDNDDDNDDDNLLYYDDIDLKDINDIMEKNNEEENDIYDKENYDNNLGENANEFVDGDVPEEDDINENDINEDDDPEITTRSGRRVIKPTRYPANEGHNYFLEKIDDNIKDITEYNSAEVKVIATCMMHFQLECENEFSFIQQYGLRKGLKVFGEKGKMAALKEVKQLHDRKVFKPVSIEELSKLEKDRAMESLAFLTEKRDKSIKARMCANGSTQREYIDRDEAASPTASTDSILLTSVIDAKQGRDVMTADVPNAFVQCRVTEINGERIVMKIRGDLVDILLELDPTLYGEHVVHVGKSKILYVLMLKGLYGMLIASLLYYRKFVSDIKKIGFELNPYDPCTANRSVNGSQHTIVWHVDDIKSSHKNKEVNDRFFKWLEKTYGEDGIGRVKVVRGLKHDYLAMTLDFNTKGKLKLDMVDYTKKLIQDFPYELRGQSMNCPWTEKLFKVDQTSPVLDEKRKKIFHTFVMKGMFLCKRGRPDIHTGITFLSMRTGNPNNGDWEKLVRLLKFLNLTKDDVLTLEASDDQSITWFVDAAFAVHEDMRSHSGATMTLGKGMVISGSTKQKINTRSSTEAELVAMDDYVSKVLWTKLFIEAQGFTIRENIVLRDNTSCMKLEKNGKWSSGKRTRHLKIKYFYVTDLIERNEIELRYCPTGKMIGDYMTKPLVGCKFKRFRSEIMNLPDSVSRSVLE